MNLPYECGVAECNPQELINSNIILCNERGDSIHVHDRDFEDGPIFSRGAV